MDAQRRAPSILRIHCLEQGRGGKSKEGDDAGGRWRTRSEGDI